MIPEHDIRAMRERLEAATEGPWARLGVAQVWSMTSEGDTQTSASVAHALSQADAEFIAHARTDLARLLEERETLREALELARSGWAHYRDGQKAKGTRLLDAALSASPEEARDDA